MSKLLTIIKREYLTRVKSKGFIIGTILSPLVMSSFIVVPFLLGKYSGPDKYRVVALDQSGDAVLVRRIEALLEPKRPEQARYEFTQVTVASESEIEAKRPELSERMAKKEIDGYVVLPADVLSRKEITFYAKNAGSLSGRTRMEDAISRATSERRIELAGLNAEQVRSLTKEITLKVVNERGESGRGRIMLALSLMIMIYLTVLIYGITVMRGVTEEKQNRIIEVLLSSVRPFDLLMGKVIGIGLVGLTQYVFWALCGLLLSGVAALPAIALYSDQVPKLSFSLMFFFVVYYLLGYFLYATLYAMVGSIVSNDDDGQQAQMPITMTFMIAWILSVLVMENPTGTAATILSLIPFFGPSLMFMRIALEAAPGWQIALSIALMVATIIGVVWLAAKIYRVGVLMYGKRPTIPELVRWLRYS
jgi:ABC-2 type transport system permease protein